MNLDKSTLVNIVLMIHMALTGLMLFKLFKFKSITGGQLILTFIALIVPVLGPSGLLYYYNSLSKRLKAEEDKKKFTPHPKVPRNKRTTKK